MDTMKYTDVLLPASMVEDMEDTVESFFRLDAALDATRFRLYQTKTEARTWRALALAMALVVVVLVGVFTLAALSISVGTGWLTCLAWATAVSFLGFCVGAGS